jgi:hypothetical protein
MTAGLGNHPVGNRAARAPDKTTAPTELRSGQSWMHGADAPAQPQRGQQDWLGITDTRVQARCHREHVVRWRLGMATRLESTARRGQQTQPPRRRDTCRRVSGQRGSCVDRDERQIPRTRGWRPEKCQSRGAGTKRNHRADGTADGGCPTGDVVAGDGDLKDAERAGWVPKAIAALKNPSGRGSAAARPDGAAGRAGRGLACRMSPPRKGSRGRGEGGAHHQAMPGGWGWGTSHAFTKERCLLDLKSLRTAKTERQRVF